MLLGGIGVTIGFPAAAAGEVAARIFDKAHHIVERIAQKYADVFYFIAVKNKFYIVKLWQTKYTKH